MAGLYGAGAAFEEPIYSTGITAFETKSTEEILEAIAASVEADANAIDQGQVQEDAVERFGVRMLKTRDRAGTARPLRAVAGAVHDLSRLARTYGRVQPERPEDRERAINRIIAGGEHRDHSRAYGVALELCTAVSEAGAQLFWSAAQMEPPPGVLRATALTFGELLAWAALDPVTLRWPEQERERRTASERSRTPVIRARRTRVCRAIGALAACTVAHGFTPGSSR
jgi:hypothetical protein